jgi:hypothetical protein
MQISAVEEHTTLREAIKKKSQISLMTPPPAELGTTYLIKQIIAYFNSTASETNFKHGF